MHQEGSLPANLDAEPVSVASGEDVPVKAIPNIVRLAKLEADVERLQESVASLLAERSAKARRAPAPAPIEAALITADITGPNA